VTYDLAPHVCAAAKYSSFRSGFVVTDVFFPSWVTDMTTQAGATVFTDSSEHFMFPSLLPSTYTLEAQLQGFKAYN